MAEITNVFKATLKSIRSRRKRTSNDTKSDDTPNIFPAKRSRGQFETTAREVVSNITALKEFLLKHRKDYVNAGSHLSGEASHMTDTEREEIDNQAQNIIKGCQDRLSTVQKNAETEKVHPQVKEHRESVLTLINAYLKMVCKLYSEQKAVRVKRVVDRKRIARIEPEQRALRRMRSQDSSNTGDQSANAQASTSNEETVSPQKPSTSRVPSHEASPLNDSEDEISAEEAQMFAEENQALFEEMNSISDEVSKIQGKVVEIASLQEIFTEKVLQQEEDLVRVADMTVLTTENIKEGNEEIREAMRKNAGFRVWILFFLLVLTFSLLFLDWYSS